MNSISDITGAPYKAIDIARYIIAVTYENGDSITNLKLQKLLYYAQAWYMVHHDGKRLFSDEIEAWKFGPVIRVVYIKYKRYGNGLIDKEEHCEDNIFGLAQCDLEFIKGFSGEFMQYTAGALVDMIHREDPWIEVFDESNPKASVVISPESMYRFYKSMYEKEMQLEEDEDAYYMKIIGERINDPTVPAETVWKSINVEC
jgi:uncharacterized phage-associated protein